MREAVIALIALVALYMVFVLLRMRHLRRRPPEISARKDGDSDRSAPQQAAPELSQAPDAALPAGDEWTSAPPRLADEVLRQGLEQEVAQLREELDAIRGELAALREDMLHEMAHMRATQSVSPIYGDAMQMAAAGYEPAMIAERCGIARAEAELVVALAKSQER